ncbi:MAG: DUF1385 domain-containing protein [Oscillospiraceae bacterium]|nr:DUF1385 domain-containing protein [Oscillospiraceae bacterium]
MEKKEHSEEKFKTAIGGQALIEGIMMRGPKLDAIVVRGKDGVSVETTPRKIRSKNSPASWPFIRGAFAFFDAQVVGVKALMRSADLAPEETQEDASKFDKWLEKKLGDKKFQELLVGISVVLGLGMSIFLFFLIPMLIGSFVADWINNNLLQNLLEGVIRILIFVVYILLVSKMPEMKRVFAYHGAEHKTIRCYEAGLPLTVENVRKQTRLHPRCGTSFLLIVMILSILLFSAASSLLLATVPALNAMSGTFLYKLLMILFKLLLLPLVVSVGYEINRVVGRYDNAFTRILTAPGMWFQNFTTREPDDDMIEVGIAALTAVLPEQEGEDRW